MSTATARTTIVRPADPAFHSAMMLAATFAAIKLALHVGANLWQAHLGWGYFRDEFYYIACGRHLAWGYVDHGPIVAVQARLSELLFGRSLAGLRFLSALAGAARVFLTGILAWSLGGRRPAQAFAMLGVLLAPQYLGLDSFLSMNSFESLFWMTCILALILIVRNTQTAVVLSPVEGTAVPRLWILFGISAGIGLLNKPSMTFFLIALLFGLLLSPQRKLLLNRWAIIAIGLLILIALPNLLWQIANHWPTLEFLSNGRKGNKNISLSPVAFLLTQIVNLQPLAALIWIPGIIWLIRNPAAKPYRWLAWTYLLFLALMMALHAKDYYVVPIYPYLFAAGGIAWEQRFAHRRAVQRDSPFAFPIYSILLILNGLFILPLAIPVFTPAKWIGYTHATGLYRITGNTENESSGSLPQFYADRFGWQEEVNEVTRIYNSLSPEDRQKAGILASNYGEAGAIDLLGHGLPPAACVHNNYFLWGPHGYTGELMIVVNGASPEEMRKYYDSVEIAGRMDNPLSMPYERRNIYLARGRKKALPEDWPNLKVFF